MPSSGRMESDAPAILSSGTRYPGEEAGRTARQAETALVPRRELAGGKREDRMIKIEAIVRPERIGAVMEALDAAGCGGFNYMNVTGRGNQQGIEVFTGRGGQTARRSALPKVMITTVVDDEKKDAVVEAILRSARSDEPTIGDGKIFISPVSEVIRVRTGERDGDAL